MFLPSNMMSAIIIYRVIWRSRDYCECVTSFGAVLKPLHVGKDSKRNGKNKSLYLSHAVLQFLTPDLSVKSFLKVLLGVSIT